MCVSDPHTITPMLCCVPYLVVLSREVPQPNANAREERLLQAQERGSWHKGGDNGTLGWVNPVCTVCLHLVWHSFNYQFVNAYPRYWPLLSWHWWHPWFQGDLKSLCKHCPLGVTTWSSLYQMSMKCFPSVFVAKFCISGCNKDCFLCGRTRDKQRNVLKADNSGEVKSS